MFNTDDLVLGKVSLLSTRTFGFVHDLIFIHVVLDDDGLRDSNRNKLMRIFEHEVQFLFDQVDNERIRWCQC